MNSSTARLGAVLAMSAGALYFGNAQADGNLRCSMRFAMHGWSAFYKTSSGHGTVSCNDGSSMEVALSSKGGGLTLGKSSIDDGLGDFTGVSSIRDVLGAYATGEAHSTASESGGTVAALTKGEVSLALKGTGHGFDAGVDFGKFTISEVSPAIPPAISTEAPPTQ